MAMFGAPYNRFVPIFATNILRVGPTGFGILMSAPGFGATLAALVLASVRKMRVGIRWICAFVIGFALSLAFSLFRILSCCLLRFSPWSAFARSASARCPIPRFRSKRHPICWAAFSVYSSWTEAYGLWEAYSWEPRPPPSASAGPSRCAPGSVPWRPAVCSPLMRGDGEARAAQSRRTVLIAREFFAQRNTIAVTS